MRKYQIATADYGRAIDVLQVKKGVLKKRDYDTIWNAAEQYRAVAEEARSELDSHIGKHRC